MSPPSPRPSPSSLCPDPVGDSRLAPAVGLVACLEGAREKHATLVEERERDDGLGDADALPTENAAQPERSHVRGHLLDSRQGGDRVALDRVRLHDDFESRERVGDDDVDRGYHGGGDEVGGGRAEAAVRADLFLHPLLQLRLADEAEQRRGEGVAHQRDGAAEERQEVLRRGLLEDVEDGLLGARLLHERALLLLNHPDRVDERRREDGGASSSKVTHLARVGDDKGETKQNAKLGNTLEENADQSWPKPREGSSDRSSEEYGIGL
mmetsp:Transcript_28628/g.61580  ORF Transcript_28628/g.61580 Transcript_28628/m.61580 type:complete len:267 (-) Transcript_28628:261-1061(-)